MQLPGEDLAHSEVRDPGLVSNRPGHSGYRSSRRRETGIGDNAVASGSLVTTQWHQAHVAQTVNTGLLITELR